MQTIAAFLLLLLTIWLTMPDNEKMYKIAEAQKIEQASKMQFIDNCQNSHPSAIADVETKPWMCKTYKTISPKRG